MCPGGEGADLKSVGPQGLAGSNPVHGANKSSLRSSIYNADMIDGAHIHPTMGKGCEESIILL